MNKKKTKQPIRTMKELEARLRRTDRKQAGLYLLCNFISLMLMTAYSALMFSPTVLNIFPEGGDSLRQLYMIFIMTLFGCTVFTVYAASLFFRKKSRQLGILMALGASRKTLAPGLFREVILLSGSSAFLGILAGFPFIMILWKLFRFFIVDNQYMVLNLDFSCLWIPLVFALLVLFCACLLAFVYLRKTDILDVIQEEHQNEPVRELGLWCGPVGIILLIGGAMLGYNFPTFYRDLTHRFPSALLKVLCYSPVFAGLYMIMLHTVVNGWRFRRKNPWKNIVARSMMKFQGKQTVNSLLVTTVLIAGGCFGIFYLPMLGTGTSMTIEQREYDYSWFWPSDQNLPSEEEIQTLAKEHKVQIADWKECPYLSLAVDSNMMIDNDDGSFSWKYYEIASEGHFLSESDFNKISGQNLSVEPGEYYAVTNKEETSYRIVDNSTRFTNMTTREVLPVSFKGFVHFEQLGALYVGILDDGDFQKISQGLTPKWHGTMAFFNSKGKDSHPFARAFYEKIVASFDDDSISTGLYDPVEYLMTEGYTNDYFGTSYRNADERLDRSQLDSADFRMSWNYMPQFRVLDSKEQLNTFSVFMMTFLFIGIVCFTAALVISYTRCQTLALNNAYVFYDLKRLGASPEYLSRELRRQAGPVFKIPAVVGMSCMVLLYGMMLYANDNRYTQSEIAGFLVCLEVIAVIALLFYAVFLKTLSGLRRQLEIHSSTR
ncbi:ABC transporter permease [Blautia sp.]|uniref:FtsX-like permease family protein n=1 Tax=Blautia glucerasea TaxID=536633 RepID=A0A6N2V8G9_9FIRM